MGAMLNVQLDRLDGFISTMHAEKSRVLAGTAHLSNFGLTAAPMYSPDQDCAAQIMYMLPTETAAQKFADTIPIVVAAKRGRYTFPQWDQIYCMKGPIILL